MSGNQSFFCFEVMFMLRVLCDFPDTPREKGIEEISFAARALLSAPVRYASPDARSEGTWQGALASQPSIRFPWPGLCSCRADVPPDFELASSRAGMGIEFIARAVPLPGSIREVPINVKER